MHAKISKKTKKFGIVVPLRAERVKTFGLVTNVNCVWFWTNKWSPPNTRMLRLFKDGAHRYKKYFILVIRIKTEEKAKVAVAVWGTEFYFLPHKTFSMILKKRMNRIKGYLAEWILWKNRWSSGSHYTKPPPYQNECSPKNFCSYHPCC